MNDIVLNINAGFKTEHTGEKKQLLKLSPTLEYKNDVFMSERIF